MQKNQVILYFHGGGFCMGIYHANREFAARLSKIYGMDIYMPDYSLAPEHPFPAALNDAIAAYKGLLDAGYNAQDIFIMGDSSGCALAVCALLMLRQYGFAMPRAMAFLTPVFDLAGASEPFAANAAKDPFQLKDPLGIAKLYVAENDPASPMLSPLFGDLSGLPPMLIHAAEYDVFAGDAERFAKKAADSGISVEYKVWRSMWHIFHMQASFVPEARKALKEVNSFLERYLS
jgi:acetyl esterase/lipase